MTESRSENDSISPEEFNDMVHESSVGIKFGDAPLYKTENVILIRDSLEYTDSLTLGRNMVSWKDVRFVRREDRIGGAIELGLLSIIPAIVIGLDWTGLGGETHKGKGATGAAITIGVGALLGYAIGKDQIYDFNDPDD